LCPSSPSSFGELSVITLVALAIVTLAFFVTLVVILFTTLAIYIRWCLLSATIARPSSADAGVTAASCLPAERLLPFMALYFIMADCYVVTSAPAPSSHSCSHCHCCHCIVVVSSLANLTEESIQKKKRQKKLFLITAQNRKSKVKTGLFSESKNKIIAEKTKKKCQIPKYQGIYGWNIAHIPRPRDLQEHSPQPRSAPHKFDHDISVPSPDGRIFITTAIFQQTKMKGDVTDHLISRIHCSQRAAD
jgi:hypothetical protein